MKICQPFKPYQLTPPEELTWDCDIGTGQDRQFRALCFSKFDPDASLNIAKHYYHLWHKHGIYAANTYLRLIAKRAQKCALPTSLSDDQIVSIARLSAKQCKKTFVPLDENELIKRIVIYISCLAQNGMHIHFPKHANAQSMRARLCDHIWWRRWLRNIHSKELEAFHVQEGFVSKKKSIYVSQPNLRNRLAQTARTKELLSSLDIINELDERFGLNDIIEKSIANPKIRRAELMARLNGAEGYAKEIGFEAVFVTITCPGRMHAVLSMSGDPNPNYDGTTPKDAQRYLCNVWGRARAKLKRSNLRYFGVRVAEPHHDGTPHWHLLLFIHKKNISSVLEMISYYAKQIDQDEKGADKYRFKSVLIDDQKGSAIGYIAKYISKNIDGFGMDEDLYGKPINDSCKRVNAWASVWGIRQFQFFGLPNIGIWRELRRIKEQVKSKCEKFRKAADESNYQLFLCLFFNADSTERPSVLKIWSDKENKYGDPIGLLVKGIQVASDVITTRIHEWRIELRKTSLNEPEKSY